MSIFDNVKALEALPPSIDRRVEHFHPEPAYRGLALRISPVAGKAKTSVRSWTFTYRWQGKLMRLTIGRYPAVGPKAAKAKTLAFKALLALEEPIDPRATIKTRNADKEDEAPMVTVADLIARYVAAKKAVPIGKRLRTLPNLERTLDRDVGNVIGNKKLESLTINDVNRVISRKVADGKHSAALRTYGVMGGMFRWGVSKGLPNHMTGTIPPEVDEPKTYSLNESEIKVFWNNLESGFPKSRPEFSKILRFCLATGCRLAEAGNLDFEREWIDKNGETFVEIDFVSKVWWLPKERSKNKHEFALPLSDLALELLSDDPKYPWGKPVTTKLVSAAFGLREGVPKKLGINSHATIHALRRTVASQMVKMGIPISTVSHVLNHRGETHGGVTARYVKHDFMPEKRDALDRWAIRLRELVA
jgi:integrase